MSVLRIASWNIHECSGSDRRYAPARIAQVLAAIDADVFVLQEVSARQGHADELCKRFEDAAGASSVFSPTFVKHGRPFGNALLCRLPILAELRHPLPGRGEPRNALELVVDWDGCPLRVIGTHLALRAHQRRVQVARLADLVDAARNTVLLGDFNEWHGRASLDALAPLLDDVPSPPTFPSLCAVARLDRIFASRDLRVVAGSRRDRVARMASDHLPLVAAVTRTQARLSEKPRASQAGNEPGDLR
jgi:endonuclease/exonuclease/phosphatase family metal-dependent hydrolase